MTARVLLTGTLHKPPDRKVSKNGNGYIIATIREETGQSTRYWKAFIFDEACIATVEQLGAGSPLSVAGRLEASVWTPDGKEPRVSFSVTVDGVLSARAPPRKEKTNPNLGASANQKSPGREFADRSWAAPPPPDPDDEPWR
jgi:single-stranded DNA-binding protein